MTAAPARTGTCTGGGTRRVAIVGGNRIPFARADGAYATAANQEMLSAALDGLVERYGLGGPLGTVDRERLNVAGSSLAAGHPFAATGGRIVATLAKLLHERAAERTDDAGSDSGSRSRSRSRSDADTAAAPVRGLISVCAAGGQGVTALLEA
jgi:acetyl-CoA acetyltransferase